MHVAERKVYEFLFQVGGLGYNFTIPAPSEVEAKAKLKNDLEQVIEQLTASIYHQA